MKCKYWNRATKGHDAYCRGTKDQDTCLCEGNRCNCDFYNDIRIQAQAEVEGQVEMVDTKLSYAYFNWVPMSVSPKSIDGAHPDILVCYIDSDHEVRYKAFKYKDRLNLGSAAIARDAIAWCYIRTPTEVIDKETAIKNLKLAGVLNDNGDLSPIYKSILKKVEDEA